MLLCFCRSRKKKECVGCRARQMGSDLNYVSGRKRKPGEMNGKSCNLNNCLSQIYPEGVPIPAHELVCIFDADQVANVDFFTKMIPLFDAGDDVGMVLSPQCFHNVNVEADIFNHCNINFWEYAQHGYDAFGFISCTGTNFLTRSVLCTKARAYTYVQPYLVHIQHIAAKSLTAVVSMRFLLAQHLLLSCTWLLQHAQLLTANKQEGY